MKLPSFLHFFKESDSGRLVVVFPGRFQPFHKGHASVFNALRQKFPQADVYIATSNVVNDKSPFNFAEKKEIIKFFGIPAEKVIAVVNPYKAEEITVKYASGKDKLLFALSSKDADRINYKPKKDGSAAYFKRFENELDLSPFAVHGYILEAPVKSFPIAGKQIKSASEIREMFKNGDEEHRKQIIMDLYGKFDPAIFELFQARLG